MTRNGTRPPTHIAAQHWQCVMCDRLAAAESGRWTSPPAIIGVGSHDFLYQDSVNYAAKLREVSVPLIYREYPNLNHGFFSYTAISPASAAAADQLCDDLRGLLR